MKSYMVLVLFHLTYFAYHDTLKMHVAAKQTKHIHTRRQQQSGYQREGSEGEDEEGKGGSNTW